MDTPRFLSGQLLLAMPGMGDPRFERAVIAMCVHDEDGAVGVGIGHHRAGTRLRALIAQLGLDPGRRARRTGAPRRAGRARAAASSSTATTGAGRTRIAVTGPRRA